MATQKPEDAPVRQVNNILQNLRGEHFRHTQNVQGKRAVSSSSLSSRGYSGPTLPVDLIYPSPSPSLANRSAPPSLWVPGPSPPKSWRSPAPSSPSPSHLPETVVDAEVPYNSPAWRQRALSLLFSADISRPIHPDPDHTPNPILIPSDPLTPIPSLTTLLCLQLVRTDLTELAPHLPPHLRRILMRHAAVHAPLSQAELNAFRQGATHVDAELVVVGLDNVLCPGSFHQRRGNHHDRQCDSDTLAGLDPRRTDSAAGAAVNDVDDDDAWDTVQTQDNEPSELRSLAVLSSPLNAATLLAFPPTITHLALLDVPYRIPLQRLQMICPLLVFLDLSYNAWLSTQMLEDEIKWGRLRRLEVVGLRQCFVTVTPKVLLELNRGRWEDVRVIQ